MIYYKLEYVLILLQGQESEMKNNELQNKRRKGAAALCALLLSAVMIIGCGCTPHEGGAQTTVPTTTVPTGTESGQTPGPGPSAYDGIVISKVYGNGGGNNSACEHSFIELMNTAESPVGLGGLAVYYRTGEKSEYISFELPDTELAEGHSYLIRGASASKKTSKYDTASVLDYDCS